MESAIYIRWGRRIRERRQGAYTQRALAAVIGVTPATLCKYETGQLHIPDRIKVRIAGALRSSLDELFPWPIDVPAYPAS